MPPRSKPSAADILTLIAERAESLRRAGVTSVHVDFSLTLAPWEEPPTIPNTSQQEEPSFIDPLEDPATYQNGRVPGFQRDPNDWELPDEVHGDS